MFSFAAYMDLPMIWAFIVALAVFLYVVLDGFDLGIGIIAPFAPTDNCRSTMMNSIAPFWDGNETWLVMGGGGLMIAFPAAFSALMPALYVPIIVMLIALIFRGVAFEFRYKADEAARPIWDAAFHFGSLAATFAQGVVLGTFVQGIDMEDGQFTGTMLGWLTPFSVTTGIALVFGYALLGATWTVMKTSGATKKWALSCARYVLLMTCVFMGVVSAWIPFLDPEIMQRWFTLPNMYYHAPVPIVTAALVVMLARALKKGQNDHKPFFMVIGLFVLCYIGLALGLYPYVVPRSLTVWDAAAPPENLSLLLVGALIVLPVNLFYIGYTYWVFRGKAAADFGSGHGY